LPRSLAFLAQAQLDWHRAANTASNYHIVADSRIQFQAKVDKNLPKWAR